MAPRLMSKCTPNDLSGMTAAVKFALRVRRDIPKSDGLSARRAGGRRQSAGDAGNCLRFIEVGMVARGGIEPPTRGFSILRHLCQGLLRARKCQRDEPISGRM